LNSKKRNFHDCRELSGKYKDKAIWIAGSDPSLSGYPDSFFDDKIGITLHLSHIKFPHATFRYSSEYDRSEYLLKKDPDYAHQPLIAAYPMYSKTRKETKDQVSVMSEVYFHKMVSYLPTGVRGEVDPRFTLFKVRQTMKNRAKIWGGHGSCLHTCIYMAVLMGAKEIHLIGCGHGMYGGGLEHFAAVEGAHHEIRPGYKSFDDPTDSVPIIEQTVALQQACIEAGIDFIWHFSYTPAMDDLMKIDKEWFADMKRRSVRKYGLARRIYRNFVKKPYTMLFLSRR